MPRTDGYAPIGDYAAIGDGRAFALVARDGAIDWLALPRLDSPPVFFALLDARRGGRLQLAPEDDFETARAYDEGTNVLMTTFHTKGGSVRVADAIALYELGLPPWIELVRRVEGLSGSVAMRWRFVPRFGWGECETTIELRRGSYVAGWKDVVLALHVWDAGEPEHRGVEIVGRFEAQEGASSLLALTSARAEPIPFPPRKDVERRLEATRNRWRTWSETTAPEGPHRKAAERSALALKLLTHAPTGAIAAAATTSLPEQIGGDRSYDYRYGWVRDVAFSVDALINLGLREQAHASFTWLLRAAADEHPRLSPCYRLDGTMLSGRQRKLDLDGYRGSQPVLDGNSAAKQLQLGSYGDLLETAELYAREGNAFDDATAKRIVEVIERLRTVWREAGLGHLGAPRRAALHLLQARGLDGLRSRASIGEGGTDTRGPR